MTCSFAFDDGAYILGALRPAERAEFERHLSSCAPCRHAVANLAVLPGLLGRLDAATEVPAVEAPATLLPRVLATAAARRRADQRAQRLRRRWYVAATGVAAACLAAVTGMGVHLVETAGDAVSPPGVALTAMRPASAKVTVTAEVGLVAVPSGTRVEMQCRYPAQYEGRWTVRLVVYPRSGSGSEQIGSWVAAAGDEVSVSAVTHLAPAHIARVELHREDGTALLTWSPA